MCGISAVVSLSPRPLDASITGGTPHSHSNGSNGLTTSKLKQSLETIKHRGPDARSTWTSLDGRVALGHVRLAINDLSPDGEQPFHSPDDHIHAIVNGELYQDDEARQKLSEDAGWSFKGKSDCEIVTALYQIYGVSFLRHLRGEFALCLYDSRAKLFVCARDRYGIKPLFFSEVNGSLIIGAEIKALDPLGLDPEWDVQSIADRGYAHDTRTIFKGVHKIRPGCYFTCNSSGHVDHRRYWDLEYPDKYAVDHRSEQDLVLEVRERLLEAIRLRLRADVRVGVFLSGGIDSSAIAGMVTYLVKEKGVKYGTSQDLAKIHCYSIGFPEDSGYDESEIARRTAEHLGVQFHKTVVSEQVIADNFEQATWHNEYPMPDLNFVGKYVLSDAPKEHGVKVVLTGEGSDEHFGGYPCFLADYLAENDASWPDYNLDDSERRRLWAENVSTHIFNVKEAEPTNGEEKGRNTASGQLNNINTLTAMGAQHPRVFKEWVSEFGTCDIQETIANNVDGRVRDLMADKWHPLHTAEYIWSKGFLANAILTALGDRAEMAHSLEARPPFLDHHLTQFVNNLPPSVKVRWDPTEGRFTEKWILREATKPFITEEILARRKHHFSAPPKWPIDGPLHKLMARLVTRENIERLGFVEWDLVKELVPKAFEEGDVGSFRVAGLLAQWVVLGQKFGIARACSSA